MANRPAKAGSDSGLAGAPPPVHHQSTPRHPGHHARTDTRTARARTAQARPDTRTARARTATRDRATDQPAPAASPLAWLPYLIVLAGVAAGLCVTWQGSRHARLGTGLVGAALLAAAAARLLLPSRYAALLSSRWKASDVVAFTVLGAGVLAIALALP
jgi:hypothetical protein